MDQMKMTKERDEKRTPLKTSAWEANSATATQGNLRGEK